MSRASRVPYHQNVYDLLGIEALESPQALRLIAEEKWRDLVPVSVREWHLSVQPYLTRNSFWDLGVVLRQARPVTYLPEWHIRYICVAEVEQNRFLVVLDGSDDPVVQRDNGDREDTANWIQVSETFSGFAFGVVLDGREGMRRSKDHSPDWLRAADEPFHPPVIDFLIERFGEPEVTPRPGSVSTYTWHPTGGTLRVTADEPSLAGGLSAWWVHAELPERLAEFAELLLPWGTLRDTLRADTGAARDVLQRARGSQLYNCA